MRLHVAINHRNLICAPRAFVENRVVCLAVQEPTVPLNQGGSSCSHEPAEQNAEWALAGHWLELLASFIHTVSLTVIFFVMSLSSRMQDIESIPFRKKKRSRIAPFERVRHAATSHTAAWKYWSKIRLYKAEKLVREKRLSEYLNRNEAPSSSNWDEWLSYMAEKKIPAGLIQKSTPERNARCLFCDNVFVKLY